MQSVTLRVREARDRLKEELPRAHALAPRLRKRPTVAWHWLMVTWRLHVVAALFALSFAFVLSPALDTVLGWLLPDRTVEEKLLGLIPRTVERESPQRGAARRGILILTGLGGAGVLFLLYWASLPRAFERADRTVRRRRGSNAAPGTRDGGGADAVLAADGRYRLDSEIARGGMGVIHRGFDRTLDRPVAIKELPRQLTRDPELTARFEQEARALARLAHSNIVAIHDLVREGDASWMVMELVEGGDLAGRLESGNALDVSESVGIASAIADALAAAHAAGLVHRDLKPSNILLTPAGTPKLADFGIVKFLEGSSGLTMDGVVLGSPRYMSPEQTTGATVDHRTDVYSLGVTLYEMLTGDAPFDGTVAEIVSQHIGRAPEPPRGRNESVPPELEALVLEMLSKEPDGRPGEMTEVTGRLRAFQPA